MNFAPSDEQTAILDALDRIVSPFKHADAKQVVQRAIYPADLEATLRESGFMDIGIADSEARVSSAMIIAEVAKLPVCLEVAASLLIRHVVCPDAAGPIALLWGDAGKPTRFLPQAKTALILTNRELRLLELEPGDVQEVTSLFAYPVGRLSSRAAARAVSLQSSAIANFSTGWRVGIALEIYGALAAASALTIEHVIQRRQFGKPLGAFQAIQHRLAMNATSIEAIKWMALRAADSWSPTDAALAAGYAQQAVSTIAYDVHQFSGAMGLTLEYPLHLFTYRARMLQSEFGGAGAQIAAAVADAWPAACTNLAKTG
jgi:hypothetical protein